MSPLFPIYSLATAQDGILKRRNWSETAYPASLLAGIERILWRDAFPGASCRPHPGRCTPAG